MRGRRGHRRGRRSPTDAQELAKAVQRALRAKEGASVVLRESVVSGAVKGLLNGLGAEWYSTEVGALGDWVGEGEESKFVPRPGGTRTSAGWPDLAAYLWRPHRYLLTVEVKGTKTPVRPAQWRHNLHAMRCGQPHLLVRSTEAFLTGLRFLGLFTEEWLDRPPYPHDWSQWPENALYLPRMRMLYWQQLSRVEPLYLPPLTDLPELAGHHAPPYPEVVPRPGDLLAF